MIVRGNAWSAAVASKTTLIERLTKNRIKHKSAVFIEGDSVGQEKNCIHNTDLLLLYYRQAVGNSVCLQAIMQGKNTLHTKT